MAKTERPDQEPSAPQAVQISPAKPQRRSFAKVRRELDETEFKSPAMQRILLDENERLQSDNEELGRYRELYHEADKNCAVLRERTKKSTAVEVMYSVCLCVGSVALGYAPTLWGNQPLGGITLGVGIVLIIGAAAVKLIG